MRHVEEHPAILAAIEESTGASAERVAHVVSTLRLAIDGLFLDGYTIFAPPFSLTYPSDPVATIFAEQVENASDAEIKAWNLGDMEATAKWLGVPLSVYVRHPVASDLGVLIELFDALDIEDADSPDGTEAFAIAEAWFDTFNEERRYRLSSVGLERDLEAWLIHHTERLVEIGYDVRLRDQQFVLPDRRRPDLVFDLVEDDGSTGTLIVELKATSGYLEAVDQLVGYMEAFRSHGLAEGRLSGLLVADGIPPEVLAHADDQGVDTATLSELGYRRDLAANTATPTTLTPVATNESKESMPLQRTEEPMDYILHSVASQGDYSQPVMRLSAASMDSVPTNVTPYDPDDESLVTLTQSLIQSIQDHPEFNTLNHIAVSYGGLTDSDGGPLTPHEDVLPNTRRNRRAHGYLRRVSPDPVTDDLTLVMEDGDDLTSDRNDDLFPQWVEEYEINVAAMQAATDFIQAAGEIRKNLTYVPPRGLADWLSRTPEELRGDDQLPEHIHAAADALEGLPAAILLDEVPTHFDGHAGEFVKASERVFRSVTKRLERITPLSGLDQS